MTATAFVAHESAQSKQKELRFCGDSLSLYDRGVNGV
jgi:hypothetical protein